MARYKISPIFREHLSEKLMDLGNYIALATVVSQFVTEKPISENLLWGGITGTVICYLAAFVLSP